MKKLYFRVGLMVFSLMSFASVAMADTYSITDLHDGLARVFLSWEALFEWFKIACPIV